MTLALVAGAICAVAAFLLARPFLAAPPASGRASVVPPGDGRRHLLRQVRDLDDDLAAGKLTAAEHVRLRNALEAQLAPMLRDAARPSPRRPAQLQDRPSGPGAGTSRRSRWLRRAAVLMATAAVLAAVGALLRGAVEPGPAVPGGVSQAVAPTAQPDISQPEAAGPAAEPGAMAMAPSAADLAEVDRAVARVRRHPAAVGAHLDLAHAYTGAGQPQLATVEYLAVTRLDPDHAEANTALALIAFTSGNAEEAKAMVDRALARRPGYPEALYVRGLVQAMGLKQPTAARLDFEAYLKAAPFGAHRATVETLLRLIDEESPR